MTVYIDEDLLRSTRELASRTDRAEDEILEDALRRYLGFYMLQQVWDRDNLLGEDEALRLAYEELHAMRSESQKADEHFA